MKNARKLITYLMVGVLLLSNFENRLYADENGETSHESAEIVTEISEPSTDEGSTDSDTAELSANEESSDIAEEPSETSNEGQISESTDEQTDSTEVAEPTSDGESTDSDTAEPSANEESSDTAEEPSETSNEGQISESTDEQTDSTEVAEPTSDGESTDSNNTEPSANEESSDPTEEPSENSSEDQTNNQVEKTEPTENTSEEPTNESADTNENESTGKEEKSDSSSDTTFDNDVRSSLKASVMRKNTPILRGASTFTYGTIEIKRPENYAGTGPASFVIMDRNLGATSNDITSPDSYGYLYQWGNNHGFSNNGDITIIDTQVDASEYGPNNPYSGDAFIKRQSSPYDWSSVKNDNLRGGSGDSASNNRGLDDIETTAVNRQGPCDEGYHVPSAGEWSKVLEYWCYNNSDQCDATKLKQDSSSNLYYISASDIGNNFRSELKIPFAGYRNYYDGSWDLAEDYAYLRSSSPYGDYARHLYLSSSYVIANGYSLRAFGFSVRCFKNSPSLSNSSILSLSTTSGGVLLNADIELTSRSGSFSEGTTITIDGANITVGEQTFTAQASSGATFSGRNNSCGATIATDCTITGNFQSSKQKYLITFENEDGTVLQTGMVEYGETPTYSGTPSKAADAQYTYTFSGWTPELTGVTENATYQAEFSSVERLYTINFKNDNGEELQTLSLHHGDIPKYTGLTPTKDSDQQYTYSFAGWNPEITVVTGDVDYTAQYTGTLNKYSIIFTDENGTPLLSGEFEYGTTPEYTGLTPQKTGYLFAGRDPALSTVNGETTYKATFTPGTGTTYTVKTYLQNLTQTGYELSQERTFTGTTDTDTEVIPETITGFSLSGTVEQQKIKGDNSTVVELYYDRETYTIKWYDDEGSLRKTAELPYGAVPPKDPILKPDAGGNTYVFSGWNPEIVEVTGDATYTAVYKEVKKKHTISWFNESGSLLGTTTVEYGDIPTHDPLTKTGTAEWEYVFSGWNPEITEAYTDASYKGVFHAVKRKYEIGFYDEDGTVLQTGMVEYGETPTYSGTPSKAADAQYTYTFSGWTPSISSVTEDTEYTAVYTSTINQYTVTFKNSDGEVLQSGKIEYGVTPTYNGSTPTSGGNAEFSYEFAGWSPVITAVTGDITYTATYSSSTNQYDITWKDDEGDVIDTTKVAYGTMPTHTDPEKVNTAEYTYSFSGWTPALTGVTEDATYQAEFTSTKNQYNIIFKNSDGEILQSGQVEYGVLPTYNGSTPTSGGNAEYTYTFSGWTPSISSVTEETEYTAVYTSTRNQYTITWKDDEGKLIDTETLYYGDMPKDREITKSRTAEYTYTFSGWTPEVSEVTGDITYKAEFNKTKNSYLILFINTGGIVLANPILEYGVMPEYTGEIPPLHTAEYTYTFSGWEPELTGVTQEAAYNAVYTQTKNQYEVIFKNWDGTVIQSGVFEYGQTPTSPNTGDFSVKTGYLFAGRDKPIMMVTETGIYQATIIPNTGTLYTVNTYLQNLDLTGYELANPQTLTGTTDTDTEVIPENITGFYLSGTVEQKNIEGDNSTVIDLYYKRNTYEISFNTNGGKAIPAVTGIYETSFTAPIPTYAGYNFKGWFTNTGLTEAYTGSLFKEDLTLYAKWEKKPSSGGSGGGGGGSSRIKDKCPDGDYSNSYYDGTCGTVPTNTKEEKSEQTHGSAEVIECPADVSAEDCSIYKRARKYGLTSMKTYETFNADAPVTRDEMAKIIGLYSENYLNQEPIFSEDECSNFKDLGQAKGDLGGYIIRACQLGIMGIKSEDSKPMNIFRPRDNLQKKEAITLADRAFYGNVYEGTQKYWYQSHLAHLVSLGVIKEGNEDEDFLRKEIYGLLMKLHYLREVENEEVIEAKINLDEEEKEEEHGAAEEEEETISCPEDADEKGCSIYKRARDFGLTSTKSYEAFNPNSPIKRDEMAKIIQLYTAKYLHKNTVLSEDECNDFKDLHEAMGDLTGHIVKACQFGIMGVKSNGITPMDIFRPRDNVLKREAVTLVDRAFYGNVYEGTQKYWYQSHLAHLVNLGVIETGKEDEDFLRREFYGLLMQLYYLNAM